MKFLIKIFLLLIITMNTASTQKAHAQVSVGFQVFYDDLSPFGLWVNYPAYGYVWVPNYGPDFIPYSTNGHWVFTEYGWTWVSDYSWGWAPFHYGRWDYDNYYGWIWIPDNIWGPAWVCWRRSPHYYGWAPLGPNISITIAIGGGYNPPHDHWVFVDDQYMGRNDIHNYYGPRKNNSGYINNSTVINNTYVDNRTNTTYIAGPKKEEVEKVRGLTLKPVAVKENTRPGQALNNDELTIYKPVVTKVAEVNERPSRIYDQKEVKPLSERKLQKALPNPELKKQEPEQKSIQPKEEIKKEQQVPQEQRIKDQEPKLISPKAEPAKQQPIPREVEKQEQQPKIIVPKEEPRKQQVMPQEPKKEEPKIIIPKEEPKIRPIPLEPRKQEQQPKIVQPRVEPRQQQPVQQEPRKQEPKIVQPKEKMEKQQPVPRKPRKPE